MSSQAPAVDVDAAHVAAVRRFTRLYTRRMGILRRRLLGSPFPLAEARLLYELAHREAATAAELAADLDLDPGQTSRLVKSLHARGLVQRDPDAGDGRQFRLALTAAGRAAFADLDARSAAEVGALLAGLSAADRARLVAALDIAAGLLDPKPAAAEPYLLRPLAIGDAGWVIHRHAVLYAEEYGWDGDFETLVAEIVAGILKTFDPRRERALIAERGGAIVGSAFVVRGDDDTAKLRLVYVEPSARGLGIGKRLVAESIRFARDAGYRRMMLWTNDCLDAARAIYEAAGFRLTAEEPHHSFGKDLVGQTFELALR